MNTEKILKFYRSYKWEINGALIGFGLAVFILTVGFFRTLFIALLSGIGYYIGKRLSEDKDYIKNLLERVLPPGLNR